MSRIGDMDFCQKLPPLFTEGENVALLATPIFPNPPPLPSHLKGLNYALWLQPNWPVMSGDTSGGKLPSKSGCRL